MNFDYRTTIPADFADSSRVWVYQASRLFTISEALSIETLLEQFTAQWQSHGVPVKGYANLLFGQFIIIIADETATGVSGCSTDSSVRMLQQIEQQTGVQLFDRQLLAFRIEDKVQLIPLSQFEYAVENGFINEDTLYYNNLVNTKKDLLSSWIIPVKQSWLKKRLGIQQ